MLFANVDVKKFLFWQSIHNKKNNNRDGISLFQDVYTRGSFWWNRTTWTVPKNFKDHVTGALFASNNLNQSKQEVQK